MSKKANKSRTVQDDVNELKGAMVGAANKFALPERFEVDDSKSPSITIKDKQTGRTTKVGLFAYGSVRQVLNDLFGE